MVNSSAVGRPRCVDRAAREKEAGFLPSYCWTFDTNMSEGEIDRRTHSIASGLALMRVEGFVIGAIGECQVGRLGDPFLRAETEQLPALFLGTTGTLLGKEKSPHYSQDHMQQQ